MNPIPEFYSDLKELLTKILNGEKLTTEDWNGLMAILTITAIVFITYHLFQLTKKLTSWLWDIHQKRQLAKDLHPFFTKVDIERATRHYVPTHYQSLPPSTLEEPKRLANVPKAPLLDFFLKEILDKDDERFYLILAGSGMGKTTFMINLYLRYAYQWRKKYDIKLLPLGHPKALEELDKWDDEQKKNTILLLDAFDEDQEATKGYQKKLDKIMDKVWAFREVILTCRTQFFPTEKEEPYHLKIPKVGVDGGYYKFLKVYVSPFDEDDIDLFLRRKFPLWTAKIWQIRPNRQKRQKAKQIVEQSPHLLMRPMLLNYMDDLLANEQTDYKIAYAIYETLIEKWLVREAGKNAHTKEKQQQFQQHLQDFSQALAIDIYEKRHQRKGLLVEKEEVIAIARQSGVQESILADIKLTGNSLLNRDAIGRWKFAHKSILEFFLAKEMRTNKVFAQQFNFEGMDAARLFRWEGLVFDLKQLVGTYQIGKDAKQKTLAKLTVTDAKNIAYLTIKKYPSKGSLNGLCLAKNLKEVVVYDHKKLDQLYNLYILFWYSEGRQDLRDQQDLQNRQGLLYLRDRLYLQNQPYLQDQQDLLYLRDRLYLRDWLNQLELQDRSYLRDQLLQNIQNNSIKTINTLQKANEFIKEMKQLEALLPNCNIYY